MSEKGIHEDLVELGCITDEIDHLGLLKTKALEREN
jgi:hypothetical protein